MTTNDSSSDPEPHRKGLRFRAGIEFDADGEMLTRLDVVLQRARALVADVSAMLWRLRYIIILITALVQLLIYFYGI